jgi:hypothetical protein
MHIWAETPRNPTKVHPRIIRDYNMTWLEKRPLTDMFKFVLPCGYEVALSAQTTSYSFNNLFFERQRGKFLKGNNRL